MALPIPLTQLPILLAVSSLAADHADTELDPSLVHAEHERIAGEMEQLARRQIWSGLEDKFRELEGLGVVLSWDDLVHGAWSARAMGDVRTTHERLQAALSLQMDDELNSWLRAIDTEYGQVVLTTNPVRSAVLQAEVLPFAPDKRAAVSYAAQCLDESGYFDGRLPAGIYTLAGTSFEVEPGVSLRIEVSSRRSKGRRADD